MIAIIPVLFIGVNTKSSEADQTNNFDDFNNHGSGQMTGVNNGTQNNYSTNNTVKEQTNIGKQEITNHQAPVVDNSIKTVGQKGSNYTGDSIHNGHNYNKQGDTYINSYPNAHPYW